ncbi:MAG: lytic transglycosylase F [Pseudomonadota bacterium]
MKINNPLLAGALVLILALPVAAQKNAEAGAHGEAIEAELDSIRESVLDDVEVSTVDLDLISRSRVLRVATSFSQTGFYLDGGEPRGTVPDSINLFVQQLKEGKARRYHIIPLYLPLPRDSLLDAVADGKADIAAGNLTITPARLEKVAFSAPFASTVSEVVVTGPGAPELSSIEDLAGKTVHVRQSSSYYETLDALSRSFETKGFEPIDLVLVSELLESEDVLDLVASGVFQLTVVDDHIAQLWARVQPELMVRNDLAVAEGQSIGWAFRKNSPQLEEALARFVQGHRKGTLMGNIILNRYYRDNKRVGNPTLGIDQERFEALGEYFRRYGEQYEVEWLLLVAQGYQESRLDQSVRSSAGAVGVMQIKPSTAADPNVDIPNIEENVENNIHAGTRYLAFIRNRYFSSDDIDPIDQVLFSFAAYNAGPRRIMQYRRQAAERGLDPDRWLENVEEVANRETLQYVKKIIKYFVSYREYQRLVLSAKARERAKAESG